MEDETYIELTLENEIQNLLIDEGLFKQNIPDENANFHMMIEYPQGNAIDLIQPKGKDDLIIIGCATEISKEQIPMIKAADEEVRKEFIWDIRFGINNFLVDFELYHPDDVLERFIISDEIYVDGLLTKEKIIQPIRKVFKAKLHCMWMLDKTFSINENINISSVEEL